MLQFTETHIIKCPTGKYAYVGKVPCCLGEIVPATNSDVMGGRAFKNPDNPEGDLVTVKFPVFDTQDEAIEHCHKHDIEPRLPKGAK